MLEVLILGFHTHMVLIVYNIFCLYSWVQSQLANHPDELWEDGIRDYLTHASSIMVSAHHVLFCFYLNSSLVFYNPAL